MPASTAKTPASTPRSNSPSATPGSSRLMWHRAPALCLFYPFTRRNSPFTASPSNQGLSSPIIKLELPLLGRSHLSASGIRRTPTQNGQQRYRHPARHAITSGQRRRQTHHQRLLHPGRDRQRLRLAVGEQRPPAQHLSHGHSGLGQEPLPIEHRRPAHLVHDPRQQTRLH